MISAHVPPLWLLIAIVGLPLIAETIYSPVMPTIAHTLGVSEREVEFTLTIFLWGFALGTLIWGIFSDRYGRKSMLLAGNAIFILGCVGCYSAVTINHLMVSRFIQAFGGSAGSVLGQAVCRDLFHGSVRGRVFSVITTSLACAPACSCRWTLVRILVGLCIWLEWHIYRARIVRPIIDDSYTSLIA